MIESSFAVGFDWCIERVKESLYSELASELEITKALTFLKQNDVPRVSKKSASRCRALLPVVSYISHPYFLFLPQAIETFKECGKKDNKMMGTAATNLSFVYFMVP